MSEMGIETSDYSTIIHFRIFSLLHITFHMCIISSMGLREEFQKRIEKKNLEIAELELQIREAAAYIQALQDSLRLLPKDTDVKQINPEQTLRPGTGIYNAKEAIRKAGKPLHISEILKAVGLPVDKKNRLSLAGSLASYARRKEIFTRPAPNTFGLAELKLSTDSPMKLPDNFGFPSREEIAEAQITDDEIPSFDE